MNKAYIDEECIMCSTYGKFLSNRSSDVLIMNQSELSIEDIKRDEIVLEHFQSRNIPVATVIGGGYSSDTEELASRHAIIFNVAARIYKIL